MNSNYYFKDYEYKSEIKYIYHISDIHINLQAKHEEYKQVFKNLYKFLKNDIKKNEENKSVIIITGDILHSKTELLPECIELTRNFFIKLANIMPLIFMAGNHDMNINNDNRLDALTPIYNGVPKDKPIYYLEKTGVHKFNNIFFCVTSVRDYIILDPKEIYNPNNAKLISLYHGRVNGAELFNHIKVEGENNKKTNKTITVKCFDGYDYGLFGDIHKHQFLKNNIAYAGSLIQQNHGESLKGHGLIKWNVETGDSQFHEIKNTYGYITLFVENSDINNIQLVDPNGIGGYKNNKIKYIANECPNNIHIRLLLNNTPISLVQEILSKIKENHKVVEIMYQDISEHANMNYDASITQNVLDPEYQNKLIEEYLKSETDTSQEIIEVVKKINTASNETLDKSSHTHTGHWKLLRLEFSNLYSYGEKNVIDFSNYRGIVGIIAPNHMGKSAILDIILYTLFDKFPRKGTLKDIINNRKHNYYSRIVFQIDEWNYHIEKTGFITSTGRTNSKAKFYRQHRKNIHITEILDEDNISKTKTEILKYIGNYEDIIQTNISLQHNNCIFIDSENTKRRKELERILKIDFIDELIKRASSNLQEKKAILKHLEKKCPIELIVETKTNIKTLISNIKLLDEEIKEKNQIMKDLNEIIKDTNTKIIPNVQEQLNKLNSEYINLDIDEINGKIDREKKLKKKHIASIKNYNKILLNTKKLEELHNDKTTNFKEKEQNLKTTVNLYDKDINKLYKKIKDVNNEFDVNDYNKVNNEYNILLTKEKEFIEKVDVLKNKLETEYKSDVEIDMDIKQLQKQIDTINREDLPNEIKEYLNSIPIQNVTEQIGQMRQKTQKGLKKDIQTRLDELLEIHKDLSIHNYLDKYNNKIEEIHKEHKQLKIEIALCKDQHKKKRIILNNIQDITKTQSKLSLQIMDKKNTLKHIKRNKENLENNALVEKKIHTLQTKKDTILQNINDITASYNNFLNEYSVYKDILLINKNIKELNNCKDNITKNSDEINKLFEWSKQNDEYVLLLDEKETEYEEVKDSIQELQDVLNQAQSKFVANNTNLNNLKQDVKTMKNIEKELNIFNTYSIALKQLPYIIIKNVKPILEKKINDLLSVVTDFMVKIEIESTKIDIYIDRPIYDGKMVLLNNASGFERFISGLAIRLALLDISLLPKPNFIAIDEGWSAFDYSNINNVKNIFDFLATKFEFVLSISHMLAIKGHCNHQINLEKDTDGYSKIRTT